VFFIFYFYLLISCLAYCSQPFSVPKWSCRPIEHDLTYLTHLIHDRIANFVIYTSRSALVNRTLCLLKFYRALQATATFYQNHLVYYPTDSK